MVAAYPQDKVAGGGADGLGQNVRADPQVSRRVEQVFLSLRTFFDGLSGLFDQID